MQAFPKYESYKDSRIAWLGEIPSHWELKRKKYLFSERVQKGFPDEPLLAATQSQGVVRKTDYDSRTVEATKDFHLLKLVKQGDFVISLRSFEGGIEFAHYQGIISPAYTVLVPLPEVESCFYRYFLKSPQFIQSLKLFVTGIREGQNIDYTKLSRAFLPCPPAEEAKRIANFLDQKTAEIDEAIAKKQCLIELLKEQKTIQINLVVTKGLNPDVPMRGSGVEWAGEVPEHWEVKKLKFIKSSKKNAFVDGPFGSNLKSEHFIENGDVYVIESGHITNGYFSAKDDFKTISEKHFKTISRSEAYEGDIIIAKIGARYGMNAILPQLDKQSVVSGNSLKFTPNNSLVKTEYLHLVLLVAKQSGAFIDIVNVSAQPALSLGGLNNISVMVPPLSEQIEIIDEVATVSASFDRSMNYAESSITLLQEFKQSLISSCVTGKIKL